MCKILVAFSLYLLVKWTWLGMAFKKIFFYTFEWSLFEFGGIYKNKKNKAKCESIIFVQTNIHCILVHIIYKKSHHLITALMLHFKESRLMSPMSNNLNSSSYHCSTEAYRGLHWLCFNLKTVILFIVLSKYIILWPHI